MGISHDQVNRSLGSATSTKSSQDLLLGFTRSIATSKEPGYLIGDDTVLTRFSKQMEGVDYMYSSLEEKVVKGAMSCCIVLE